MAACCSGEEAERGAAREQMGHRLQGTPPDCTSCGTVLQGFHLVVVVVVVVFQPIIFYAMQQKQSFSRELSGVDLKHRPIKT